MNKNLLVIFIVIALVLGVIAAVVLSGNGGGEPQTTEPFDLGPLDATYTIDGDEVVLIDGKAEEEIVPGSASLRVTKIFGKPVFGDLNNDGVDDAAVMITRDSGGSGTFYYIAAAIKTEDGYRGSNAMLLGDRISPRVVLIKNMAIAAYYTDYAAGESFASQPTDEKVLYARYEQGTLSDAKVFVESPQMDQPVGSPLTVEGWARGVWFFEGSFPLVLVDWDGRILTQGYVTAQESWMTQEYVPFKGTLTFNSPEDIGDFSDRGALILQKDNPSGLGEFDDAVELPITFARQ